MSNRESAPERRGLIATLLLSAIGCVALLLPAGAGAATVANGDFETGTLSGWVSVNSGPSEGGSWFAYSGTIAPLSEEFEEREVPPPPQGRYAAISDETGPGLHVLYQDIAIEPALSQTLSMLVYYNSYAEIAVPSPDTLSSGGEGPGPANQQYRIDVMKPSAAVDSVNPGDILTTVFRTNPGDPEALTPKVVTANLTPFAGQTVRLRLAEVDNEFYFNAGADSVSISTVPLPPSNAFTFGKLKLNKKKGTGALQVNVPGPGILTAVDAGSSGAAKTSTAASISKKKAPAKLIKKASVTASAAGQVVLTLKPTGAGKKVLRKKQKLKFKVLVTFTPTGGTAASQTFSGTLKSKAKPKRRSGRY
jgi:hypothetical protein